MERGCIDGRSLGEEELAGFAQQAFMSDQNGGQNGIYNAENNGSVQVSKKDGAVEDTISEDLQELQGNLEEYLWWENLLMASNAPSPISCNLEPLTRGSVKFTVDGAAVENLAGCGGILREESGNIRIKGPGNGGNSFVI
ncbi:hypothetical protein V6N13_123519 [Hibiscus sabdariffa]